MTCVFECFQSHCDILKELYEFLSMMDAITIFRDKVSWPACTFEEVVE
jgi:hypothetical protein